MSTKPRTTVPTSRIRVVGAGATGSLNQRITNNLNPAHKKPLISPPPQFVVQNPSFQPRKANFQSFEGEQEEEYYDEEYYDEDADEYFEDVEEYGNGYAHNPNFQPNNITKKSSFLQQRRLQSQTPNITRSNIRFLNTARTTQNNNLNQRRLATTTARSPLNYVPQQQIIRPAGAGGVRTKVVGHPGSLLGNSRVRVVGGAGVGVGGIVGVRGIGVRGVGVGGVGVGTRRGLLGAPPVAVGAYGILQHPAIPAPVAYAGVGGVGGRGILQARVGRGAGVVPGRVAPIHPMTGRPIRTQQGTARVGGVGVGVGVGAGSVGGATGAGGEKPSKADLDADLEDYMKQSTNWVKEQLDTEIDQYMKKRQ